MTSPAHAQAHAASSSRQDASASVSLPSLPPPRPRAPAVRVRLHPAGIGQWAVTRTPQHYAEYFSGEGERGRLVYLTADSATQLEELDEQAIYIIGGLVDHNK